MKSASHAASRAASRSALQPGSTRAEVFDVHRCSSSIDNQGVAGRSSIIKRSAVPVSGGAGVAMMFAAILGALTLAHLVRTFAMRRGAGGSPFSRLNGLRTAILGVQKKQIVAVLGLPRATIGRGNYLADDT